MNQMQSWVLGCRTNHTALGVNHVTFCSLCTRIGAHATTIRADDKACSSPTYPCIWQKSDKLVTLRPGRNGVGVVSDWLGKAPSCFTLLFVRAGYFISPKLRLVKVFLALERIEQIFA